MKIQDRGARREDSGMRGEDSGSGIEDSGSNSKCVNLTVSLTPQSSILDPALLSRIRWRCRRGLLELDIVLRRFIEAHYANLSVSERQIFEEFLDMPDNPLWDMISRRQ